MMPSLAPENPQVRGARSRLKSLMRYRRCGLRSSSRRPCPAGRSFHPTSLLPGLERPSTRAPAIRRVGRNGPGDGDGRSHCHRFEPDASESDTRPSSPTFPDAKRAGRVSESRAAYSRSTQDSRSCGSPPMTAPTGSCGSFLRRHARLERQISPNAVRWLHEKFRANRRAASPAGLEEGPSGPSDESIAGVARRSLRSISQPPIPRSL